MFQPGVSFHLDETDQVRPGLTRDPGTGRVITDVKIVSGPAPGVAPCQLMLVGPPRVLRRILDELTAAVDEAVRREDAMTDTVLPFEAVQ